MSRLSVYKVLQTADTEMDSLECRLLFMVLSVSYPIDVMQYFHEPQKQEFKGQPQANAMGSQLISIQ